MRLIDADKFILALMDASLSSVDEDTILDLVDSIPTVDAVVVTRCKNCASGMVSDNNKYIICCDLGVSMGFDDYCSHGKRKENKDG